MAERGKTRRRGDALERDILKAAWDELGEVGYTHLTMEGVAERAKTSKAVLYRRWPSRARLVAAAAMQELPPIEPGLPDTGSLRGDVLALLAPLSENMERLGAETIHGLLAELLADLLGSMPEDAFARVREGGREKMTVLLERAAQRGEVRRDRITPRIASLPVDLMRHDVVMTQEPLSRAALEEIVDQVFLPLVLKPGDAGRARDAEA